MFILIPPFGPFIPLLAGPLLVLALWGGWPVPHLVAALIFAILF